MDIRKADSKGRITGFLPGQHYAFNWEKGYIAKIAVYSPDGRPIEDALEQDLRITEFGPEALKRLNDAFDETRGMHEQAYRDLR